MQPEFKSQIDMLLFGLDIMTGLFILLLFGGIISVIYMYIVDKRQTKQAIRHNYPVIGRFRYLFEKQGEFFRQYFLHKIVKKCLSTELNGLGFIARQKMLTAPSRLARHVISIK
ncbi:hypothetical protein MOVI109754_13885 [Moritella viscosa]